MDFSDATTWAFVPIQILFVDLLLGADNALVIALVCRKLPPDRVWQAATIGVVGAIWLRLLLALFATTLLAIPLVKILGALALAMIAMNLAAGEELGGEAGDGVSRDATDLWSAAAIIIVADAAMSLDNVVALAAIARGNFWLLAIGVALSLPVLGYGGVMLAGLLQRAPGLIEFGAALLGWIAGGMALSDPIFSSWADVNAPALVAFAPALGAGFVFLHGRWVGRVAPARAAAPIPRRPLPAPIALPPAEPAPPTQYQLAPTSDHAPEPEDHHEPERAPASRGDRIAIIGVLLLAVAAGAFLMVVSYLDSIN